MSTQFSSFNRSPLGAFRKSPLGARGGLVDAEDWILDFASVSTSWTSKNGLSWGAMAERPISLTQSPGGYYAPLSRIFYDNVYVQKPYSSSVTLNLDGSPMSVNVQMQRCIRSGSNLIGHFRNTSSGVRALAVSTDGGGNWSTVTPPSSTGGATFQAFLSYPMKAASGRVLMLCRYFIANSYLTTLYSDDDGATWNTSRSAGVVTSLNYQPGPIYENAGTIWHIPGSGASNLRRTSTDDGLTWSSDTASAFSLPIGYDIHAIASGRIFGRGTSTSVYSDNNGASFSAVTSAFNLGIILPSGNVYGMLSDQLYISTNAGQTGSLITTSPSTLTNGAKLFKYGQR